MAIKLSMTWVASAKRWQKNYKGTMYAVSCRQLEELPTKEASWRAANEWWAKKEKEIDGIAKQKTDQTARRIMSLAPVSIVEEAEAGLTADLIRRFLERLTGKSINITDSSDVEGAIEYKKRNASAIHPGSVAEALGIDGEIDLNKRLDRLAVAKEQTLSANSVATKAKEWLAIQRSRTNLPKPHGLHIQTYDGYRRELETFVAWLPSGATIDQITGNCWERWYSWLSDKLASGEWKPSYCDGHQATVKMFLTWLSQDEELDYMLPKKVHSKLLKFHLTKGEPQPVPIETVRMLLNACTDEAQKTGLFILLAVQCGMLQSDISSLAEDEVDLESATIKRPRSKVPDGPKVTYRLWPETLALLKRYRAKIRLQIKDHNGKPLKDRNGNPRYHFLLTEANAPWIQEHIGEDGIHKKTDNVHSAWERLRKRLKLAEPVQFMRIRKTGANKLQDHPSYKFFSQYMLAHAPRTIAEQHYVVPSDREFAEALDWLRLQILPPGWSPRFADEAEDNLTP